ncbi:MAG: hypothetical protein JSV62_11250 [Promethearchaeota archaeon]|nr:MAG: hypothetical protein JSV62_11250 [Candidatus Lokiarchaeota archaeon]
MKESLTPIKIFKDFLAGDLGRENAVELFISLIESSNNTEIRVTSTNMLHKLKFQNEKIYKILENCLISDENAVVRASAANYIIHNFSENGLSALKWVIQHEKSPLVLKTFFDSIETFKNPQLQQIRKDLLNWNKDYAVKIGVVPQESKFFLDLEALFAKSKINNEIEPKFFENFKKLSNIKNGEPWLVINKQHVEILNFNYFSWNWVKENLDIVDSLYNFKYLDVYFNSLIKYNIFTSNCFIIPNSIGRLKYLRKLILRCNLLKKIPNSIRYLISLKELDLSFNEFVEIPQIISKLKSLKKLNMKGNKLQEIPNSFKSFFNSLKDFKY